MFNVGERERERKREGRREDDGCWTRRLNWTITHLSRRLPLAAGKRRRFFSVRLYLSSLAAYADACPPMILRYAEFPARRSSSRDSLAKHKDNKWR